MATVSSIGGTGSSAATTPSSSTTAQTGLNTSGIQFNGLASGLDTGSIIQGLLAIDQAKITQLTNTQQAITKKQTAFKALEAQLLTLQTASDKLSSTFNNVLQARTVTSSNPALVTASASSGAPTGTYSFRVAAIAQAAQVVSQGYSSPTSAITQGTIQFRVGSGAATTVTVGPTNATLQGLANAINDQSGDVTATVVNDGTTGQPYHILLSSRKTGVANAIAITNNLAADNNGAVQPTFGTVVQAATDASVTLGSGAGAFSISSPTNQVDGVFAGVTLNLLGADPGTNVTLQVATDTAAATGAVQDFVNDYNGLVDAVNQGSTYNASTGSAGIFLGDSNASGLADALTSALSSAVPGLKSQANTLSAVGITLSDNGDLVVDSTKLTQAINGQLPGVSAGDVARIFSLSGDSDNAGVNFIFAGGKTATGTPIQVQITQAATQASLSAASALPGSITVDSTNGTLGLTVDGKPATVTLAPGTYTPQTLAAELQAELAANAVLANTGVQVALDGTGRLSLTSGRFGTSSQVVTTGGTALATLGFTAGASAVGQNVAGSFVVGGVTEAAQGNGQILSGLSGNANTGGLQLRVTLGPSQIPTGPAGNVTVTRGLASRLGQILTSYLDPVNGRLKSLDQSFKDNISSIQTEIATDTTSMKAKQLALQLEFANMEATIAQLQTTGSFLSQQFNSLAGTSSSSSSSSSKIG